jgi:hypothetical protein
MLFARVNPLIINMGSGTTASTGRKRTQLTLTLAERAELAHLLRTCAMLSPLLREGRRELVVTVTV